MRRYGLFHISSGHYAVALPEIIRIVENGALYRLPRLPGGIAGVLVEGASLVPLLNLSRLFGGDYEASLNAPCQVLVQISCGEVALPAEQDGRIVSESKGCLADAESGQGAWVRGEFRYGETGYQLLDIEFLAIEMTQGFLAEPA